MTFSVVHWDARDDGSAFRYATLGKISLSIQLEIVMCLHFSMQEEGILEHANAMCDLCTVVQSTCRPFRSLHIRQKPHTIIE